MESATARTKLIDLFNKVPEGRVLDVSVIKPNGTGSKIIDTPKTQRSTKRGIEGLPIVSDNYPAYKFVVETFGGEFAQYAQFYAQQHGTGYMTKPEKSDKPAKSAKKSPKSVVPKETIASLTLGTAPAKLKLPKKPKVDHVPIPAQKVFVKSSVFLSAPPVKSPAKTLKPISTTSSSGRIAPSTVSPPRVRLGLKSVPSPVSSRAPSPLSSRSPSPLSSLSSRSPSPLSSLSSRSPSPLSSLSSRSPSPLFGR